MKIELVGDINGAQYDEPRVVSWFAELDVSVVERDQSFSHEYGVERKVVVDYESPEGIVVFEDADGGEVFIVGYEELEADDDIVMCRAMKKAVVSRIEAMLADGF